MDLLLIVILLVSMRVRKNVMLLVFLWFIYLTRTQVCFIVFAFMVTLCIVYIKVGEMFVLLCFSLVCQGDELSKEGKGTGCIVGDASCVEKMIPAGDIRNG